MTKQEALFFDRVAMKITETGCTIEEGCQSVLSDDRRILNAYARMSDQKQSDFRRSFVHRVYGAMHDTK